MAPVLSVTRTVKLKLPEAVGAPENCPDELRVTPGGNAPAKTDQLKGGVPFTAWSIAENC